MVFGPARLLSQFDVLALWSSFIGGLQTTNFYTGRVSRLLDYSVRINVLNCDRIKFVFWSPRNQICLGRQTSRYGWPDDE